MQIFFHAFPLVFTPFIFQTISGSQVPTTPPPAYAITIRSGDSLFVPPSYKMISGTHYSYSIDSYGGVPDYSRISDEGHDDTGCFILLHTPYNKHIIKWYF